MNCPNCGNSLVEKGKFCVYCGAPVPADLLIRVDSRQESRSEIRSEIIDHARLAEAQSETKREQEKTKRRRGCLIAVIAVAALLILPLVVIAVKPSEYEQKQRAKLPIHTEEIARLRALEDEILEDIRAGRYEQALAKASMLYYTADYDPSCGWDWDKKRQSLTDRLNELIGLKNGTEAPAE